ncbi:MAG: histidine kinase [Bacteroidetes bacterium]|nr:histidine kinase [Bacteroidota bacterium]
MVTELSSGELAIVYPNIKDTLEHIKRTVYYKAANGEMRFLFDVIEANLEQSKKNYAKAVFLAENSLQNHASNINDSLMCYSILKSSFMKIRNFIKAYEVNTKMEELWPRKSDSVNITYGIYKSGLYAALGFMDQAIAARRSEWLTENMAHDTDKLMSFYNNIGVYYNKQSKSDSAAPYFEKIVSLVDVKKYPPERKKHYDFIRGLAKGNLGLSYYNDGDIQKTIPLIQEDIYYSRKNDKMESVLNSYNLMVECYIKLNNVPVAKKYLDSVYMMVSSDLKDITLRMNYFLLKSRFHHAAGDYKTSNESYEKFFNLRDSVSLMEKEQSIANTEIAFKIEQKEQELKEKTRIIEQKKLIEAQQKTFRAYSFAGILFLLVIIIFLILNNQYTKNREKELSITNEKINTQNSQIEQSLKEKEVLIREIHHRVKNNLQIITSMLSLQIGKEEGTVSEEILREAKQRIDSIALTHQMLYQNDNLSSILIGEYVLNLVRQIEASLPASNIRLSTDIVSNKEKINIDNAIPLGLLINELLTNAYKHAFQGKDRGEVKVSLREDEHYFVLNVRDNGIGLPENFDTMERKSMGMDLIYILSEQLDAKLIIESKNGTSFVLNIPKNKLFV